MLARLAALPPIGCGTIILAAVCGFGAYKVTDSLAVGRWVFWLVFAGILVTVVLAAIVGPRRHDDDESPPLQP